MLGGDLVYDQYEQVFPVDEEALWLPRNKPKLL